MFLWEPPHLSPLWGSQSLTCLACTPPTLSQMGYTATNMHASSECPAEAARQLSLHAPRLFKGAECPPGTCTLLMGLPSWHVPCPSLPGLTRWGCRQELGVHDQMKALGFSVVQPGHSGFGGGRDPIRELGSVGTWPSSVSQPDAGSHLGSLQKAESIFFSR